MLTFFVLKSEVSSSIRTEVMAFFLKSNFSEKVDFGKNKVIRPSPVASRFKDLKILRFKDSKI